MIRQSSPRTPGIRQSQGCHCSTPPKGRWWSSSCPSGVKPLRGAPQPHPRPLRMGQMWGPPHKSSGHLQCSWTAIQTYEKTNQFHTQITTTHPYLCTTPSAFHNTTALLNHPDGRKMYAISRRQCAPRLSLQKSPTHHDN